MRTRKVPVVDEGANNQPNQVVQSVGRVTRSQSAQNPNLAPEQNKDDQEPKDENSEEGTEEATASEESQLATQASDHAKDEIESAQTTAALDTKSNQEQKEKDQDEDESKEDETRTENNEESKVPKMLQNQTMQITKKMTKCKIARKQIKQRPQRKMYHLHLK